MKSQLKSSSSEDKSHNGDSSWRLILLAEGRWRLSVSGCLGVGGGPPGVRWLETRDDAKDSTTYRTVFRHQELPDRSDCRAGVLQPCPIASADI